MAAAKIKNGETLSLRCTDSATDLTDITVTSRVCNRGWGQDLTVTINDAANGVFTLSATAEDTANWPVGSLDCDFKYTDSSDVVSYSETFNIVVQQRITS